MRKMLGISVLVFVLLLLAALAMVSVNATAYDGGAPPTRPGLRTQPPMFTSTPAPHDCYIIVRDRIMWYPCGGNE